MPIPDDFAEQAMYEPEAWYIQDVEFVPEEKRLVAVCDTTRLGPLVAAQRPWPGHERHLPGAIIIQITGTLGQLYASYVLGMKATDGWVGYGTHIHDARFQKMGRIGPPVLCHAHLKMHRGVAGTMFTRFEIRFEQEGEEIYRSEQTAAWVRSDHRGTLPDGV
ncbi:MAG: hypothetical protein JRI25_02045 [Deltaproteobacteria bacterium]|nr:hypothetical protein [Deltaproteobacteria bacterium]